MFRVRSSGRASLASLVAYGSILSAVVGGTRVASASTTLRVPEDHPSIQSAINAAAAGDVIDIAPGTYTEQLILNKGVTLRGRVFEPADPRDNTTILDGAGLDIVTIPSKVVPAPSLIGLVFRNGADGISPFSPFTIRYSYFIGNADQIDYEKGSGGLCADNVFEGAGDDALDLDHTTADLVIENNTILDARDDGIEIRLHDDMLAQPVQIVIRGNRISGSRRDGVQVIDYYQDTDRVITIERNLFRNIPLAAIGLMDKEQTVEDFRAAAIRERINVFHNTFVANDHGISGGANLIALNNIFLGHRLALKNLVGDSIASYNLFWNNATDQVGSNVDTAHVISADPLLDDSYELLAGSPAVDAGTAYFVWQGRTVMDQPASGYLGAAPDLGWRERAVDARPNAPPVVDSVAIEQASPKTNDLVTATVAAHDEDRDPLTYSYQWLKNGTELVEAIGPILDLSVVGNGDKGDAIAVRVTASDGVDESVPATSPPVTIANSDPVFEQDLQDRTSAEGDAVSVSAEATDPDGDGVTYEASGLPPGVGIDAQTGAITGTIAAGASVGSPYPVSVTVRDGSEIDDLDTFTWTVTSLDLPPAMPAALASSVTSVSIVLDWADTFEPDVIGYHVYRGESAEGPFEPLTPTPVVASAYEDLSAPPDTTSYTASPPSMASGRSPPRRRPARRGRSGSGLPPRPWCGTRTP